MTRYRRWKLRRKLDRLERRLLALHDERTRLLPTSGSTPILTAAILNQQMRDNLGGSPCSS